MSDILIKNLKFPEFGADYIKIDNYGGVYELDPPATISLASDGVKAIPIKSHGRLGDLDAMKTDYLNTTLEMIKNDPSNKAFYESLEKIVIGLIDRTPTVIEASNDK